jgi:hypothetical protein
MELLDEGGHEIPIYTESGYQIQRRVARRRKGQKFHGVLMELSRISELFTPDLEETYLDGVPGCESPEVYVYPQAGLRTAGHFQAKGLMTRFYPRVEKINQRLIEARREEMEGDEDEDEDIDYSDRHPITGIASQGYNSVMHSTRGTSNQHHDAQLGLITSTLAGAWATTERNKRIANDQKMLCEHRLPHNTYQEKIANEGIERDLRLENVYVIDVGALPVLMRNGK